MKLNLRLFVVLCVLIWKQVRYKASTYNTSNVMRKNLFTKARLAFVLLRCMWSNNAYLVEVCRRTARALRAEGTLSAAIYGDNPLSGILKQVLQYESIALQGVYGPGTDKSLSGFTGKVILAFVLNTSEHIKNLQKIGVPDGNIVRLC